MSAHKFAYLLSQKSFKLHLTLINHCFIFKGKLKVSLMSFSDCQAFLLFVSLSSVVFPFFIAKR